MDTCVPRTYIDLHIPGQFVRQRQGRRNHLGVSFVQATTKGGAMSHKHARDFSFFVLLLLTIAAAAFAAKPISDAPPVTADLSISASALQWQPAGSFDRLALTVSGPDDFSFTK